MHPNTHIHIYTYVHDKLLSVSSDQIYSKSLIWYGLVIDDTCSSCYAVELKDETTKFGSRILTMQLHWWRVVFIIKESNKKKFVQINFKTTGNRILKSVVFLSRFSCLFVVVGLAVSLFGKFIKLSTTELLLHVFLIIHEN